MSNAQPNGEHLKPILSDHRREGKKLVPPLMQIPNYGPSASYGRTSLPELVWLDTILWRLEIAKTTAIIKSLAKILPTIKPDEKAWWCFATTYTTLTAEEYVRLRELLAADGLLWDLQSGLRDFCFYFPTFPLVRIFSDIPTTPTDPTFLSTFKKRVAELLSKRSLMAGRMQALGIAMGFAQGKLFIRRGMIIERYTELFSPDPSEDTGAIIASICATTNGMVSEMVGMESDWAKSFWKRGLELEPPDFRLLLRIHDQN